MSNSLTLNGENVRDVLTYFPLTGEFFWRERGPEWFTGRTRDAEWLKNAWNSRFSGKLAFSSKDAYGYNTTTVLNKVYKAHRVAFLYMEGEWPEEVDHINRDRSDNRWSNLRNVDREINSKNRGMSKYNTSGHVGVYWSKRDEKWLACIGVNGDCPNLPCDGSKEDAIRVRVEAEKLYGYSPTNGRW